MTKTDVPTGFQTGALPPGSQLNEYCIRAVLGRGGFGITYVAEDIYLDHVVAIKEYFPIGAAVRISGKIVSAGKATGDGGEDMFSWGLQRFIDEARILAKCRHANIVRVLRYFEANGTAYLVMDFETGVSLGRHFDQLGPSITEAELVSVLTALMGGLSVVHRLGFMHRDIKPDNVLIRPDHSPVLLDFGAARQAMGSQSSLLTVIVTSGYAPIEQYSSDGDQGPWTDVYALGAIAYNAISGTKPPDALSRMRIDPYVPLCRSHRGRFSQHLLLSVDWALSFDPADRIRSMAAWCDILTHRAPIPPEVGARFLPTETACRNRPSAHPVDEVGSGHRTAALGDLSDRTGQRPRPASPSPTPFASQAAPVARQGAGAPRLELVHGGHTVVVDAARPMVTVGRSAESNLMVPGLNASRRHARVCFEGGRFRIIDASKYGTFIHYATGRLVVLKGQSEFLSGAGVISLGGDPGDADHNVTFRCIEPAARPDAATVIDLSAGETPIGEGETVFDFP